MEQEEIVYVLIDGSINLLWKINFTNVLAATKMKWKTWIILCYHINYGGCIEEPREDKKKRNKVCVEKVSVNWKLCVQENLSTLCFESLQNEIDIDVPKSLDINQKMEESRICENSLDENVLIPSQYKSLQKILDSVFKIPVTILRNW